MAHAQHFKHVDIEREDLLPPRTELNRDQRDQSDFMQRDALISSTICGLSSMPSSFPSIHHGSGEHLHGVVSPQDDRIRLCISQKYPQSLVV